MARKTKCTPCLGVSIKEYLAQLKDPRLSMVIKEIPDCSEPMGVEVCGSKRAPSAYQQHIRSCFTAKNVHGFSPETMKECAAAWRAKKGG